MSNWDKAVIAILLLFGLFLGALLFLMALNSLSRFKRAHSSYAPVFVKNEENCQFITWIENPCWSYK